MNSRDKGKRRELDFSHYLEARGIEARRGQQRAGGTDSPDVVHSLPGLHFEVKGTETLRLNDARAQARRDAGAKVPVVAWKRNRDEWVAILPMDDFLNILGYPQP